MAYNAASTRVATHLKGAVEAQGRISDMLRVEIAAVESRLRAEMLTAESRFREALAAQARMSEELSVQSQAALQALKQSSVAARERISKTERTLRRALDASQTHQPQGSGPQPSARERTSAELAVPEHKPEFDYSGFEERFRGSEEDQGASGISLVLRGAARCRRRRLAEESS